MKKYALFVVLFNRQTKQPERSILFTFMIIPCAKRQIHTFIETARPPPTF